MQSILASELDCLYWQLCATTHKISGGSGIQIWRTFVSLQPPAMDIWTIVPTHRQISGGSGIRIWRTFVSLEPHNSLRGCKQTADIIKMFNFSYLATLYYINVPKYLQFLNFLNFGDDTKRLVGLRLAMAAGKNHQSSWEKYNELMGEQNISEIMIRREFTQSAHR